MGKVLLIIAIILGGLALVALGAFFYFYNVHVFKEVRLCLGDPIDTGYNCSMVQDCLDAAGELEELQKEYNITDLPDFAREKLETLANEAVYCDETCRVKDIRGINPETFELEDLESCNPGETEVLIEIRGKEGIEIWQYAKDLEK